MVPEPELKTELKTKNYNLPPLVGRTPLVNLSTYQLLNYPGAPKGAGVPTCHCYPFLAIFAIPKTELLMLERMNHTMHEETRQGEAYSPFVNDPIAYNKKFYIESYGCAMNFSDSEIVASILNENGFGATRNFEEADLILINTCSIREKAEQTVRQRLTVLRKVKKHNRGALIGVLGCMAERLKAKFLEEEKLVDMVIGPDAYRSLPGLIAEAETGQKAVNVLLSREETYADISPFGSTAMACRVS